MKYIRYLCYIIIHKWFVFLACVRRSEGQGLRVGPALIWRGIIHDWSKFLPSEFIPYANFFYGGPVRPDVDESSMQGVLAIEEYERAKRSHEHRTRDAFDRAWLMHQHRNSHHYQHWVLREDSGKEKLLVMPMVDMFEMLADWEGAGRAITGMAGTTPEWYRRNRDVIAKWIASDTLWLVDREMKFEDCPF